MVVPKIAAAMKNWTNSVKDITGSTTLTNLRLREVIFGTAYVN